MRLDQLLVGVPPELRDLEISDLAYDNRRVGRGTLFFCVPGFTRDGHDFAADAVARGAAALVVERPVGAGVPEVEVPSVRAVMGPVAARFFSCPSDHLRVVGITGTNGKTTTSFLVRAALEAGGHRTGLLGTITSVIGGVSAEVQRTTPEAIDLQRTLSEMAGAGDTCCAMEVSSHALALRRVDGVRFAAAVFTNLTQDHLDFHASMEDYFAAKRRLFDELSPGASFINVDDPYGARLAEDLPDAVTFALDRNADYRAVELRSGIEGSSFVLCTPRGRLQLNSPLRGRFNVYNLVGAFAVAEELGVPADVVGEALSRAVTVPGRLEPVEEGQEFAVLVDYAHTPDSLENVLKAARALTDKRVHVVFGCGGDRDRGKRPLMGGIASRLADRVIITSDNPRSEDPEAIVTEILAGAAPDVTTELDRRAAIAAAIAGAERGDVVLIAGKGHEQGQELAGGRKIPFDDVAVAREVLRGGAQRLNGLQNPMRAPADVE